MQYDRRKFFKKTFTLILPILGLAAFMPLNVIASKLPISGCENSCHHSCSNTCVNTCRNMCNYNCKAVCKDMCEVVCTGCTGSCKNNCIKSTTVTTDTVIIKNDTIK